jgi:hypothetical protein
MVAPLGWALGWLASINDDLTGTSTSHPLTVIAKVVVLATLAVALIIAILKAAG